MRSTTDQAPILHTLTDQTPAPGARRHAAPVVPITRSLLAAGLALGFGLPQLGAAAEIDLSGSGSFKPPAVEQLASLPADAPFSRADLSSGKWSFLVRYEDRTADADPDLYVGRYAGAVRIFRLTIGDTTVELPADSAELIVSDGGAAFRHRESIRLQAASSTPAGTLRVGWIQVNQRSTAEDLRGANGVLASDALPATTTMVDLAPASPFDRYLVLRIDPAGGGKQPLLYLSSSQLSVAAAMAGAVR